MGFFLLSLFWPYHITPFDLSRNERRDDETVVPADLAIDDIQKLSFPKRQNRYQSSRIAPQNTTRILDSSQNLFIICSHVGFVFNDMSPSFFREPNRYAVDGIRNLHRFSLTSSPDFTSLILRSLFWRSSSPPRRRPQRGLCSCGSPAPGGSRSSSFLRAQSP